MPGDSFLCAAWRSRALPDTYLLVDREEGLERVPEALLSRFAEAEVFTTFQLRADRSLARADARTVMAAIRAQGYYLQLPPGRDPDMSAVAARNEKLSRQGRA